MAASVRPIRPPETHQQFGIRRKCPRRLIACTHPRRTAVVAIRDRCPKRAGQITSSGDGSASPSNGLTAAMSPSLISAVKAPQCVRLTGAGMVPSLGAERPGPCPRPRFGPPASGPEQKMAFRRRKERIGHGADPLATDIHADIPWLGPFLMFTCKLFLAILRKRERKSLAASPASASTNLSGTAGLSTANEGLAGIFFARSACSLAIDFC